MAALAHLSPLFSWLLGPLLVFALTEPGSYPRREAAKAFNFQLTSTIAGLGATVLAAFSWSLFGRLLSLMFLAWLVLTVVGGVKALKGEDWTNPVKQIIKLEPLSER